MVNHERYNSERNKENNCTFCTIPQENREMLGSSLFYGLFDNYPVSPGHLVIIPYFHIVSLQELTREEWNQLLISINNGIELIETTDLKKLYEKKMLSASNNESLWFCQKALAHPNLGMKPDAYNHGINDGRAAGRTVDHLHWHIIPRYEGDVVDPRGGVRYVIPELGNYKILRNKTS